MSGDGERVGPTVLRRILWTVGLLAVCGGLLALLPRTADTWVAFGPFALAPPLVAILVALVWRRIILALFIGVWLGAALTGPHDPARSLFHTVWTYTLPTFWSVGSMSMIVFTLLLMGMVGILIRGGGIAGLVDGLSRLARGRRSAQAIVGGMGTVVFFDDYANTVVVGTTARSLTDRYRISREKLAYIVDSTAAPVASVALVSTWIGIEIQYLDEQMAHLSVIAASGYGVFLHLVPYRFYCFFALLMVFVVAATGRDFGPMLRAEERARRDGTLVAPGSRPITSAAFNSFSTKEGIPLRWYNAALPVGAVLVAIFVAFYIAGAATLPPGEADALSLDGWRKAFINVTNTGPLMVAAGALGCLLAVGLAIGQRLLTWREIGGAFVTGMSSMVPAIGLIVLALALQRTTGPEALGTAEYLISLLRDVDPLWVPLAVFGVAGASAMATGTSYGTMAILLPVAVPLAAATSAGLEAAPLLILLSTGAVLDGAVYGDHCSPISDTTMLSSIGAGSDHMDHVRTQLPYATLAMGVAAVLGYVALPRLGFNPWLTYVAGVPILVVVFWLVGRRID
ncbi:MAG: Na+/H+ antiporter NhaC family protein [Pseudomonadota bacterium]